MRATKRAMIKQVTPDAALSGRWPARVVGSTRAQSTPPPADYLAASSAGLMGRYAGCIAGAIGMPCIRASSKLLPINEQIANSRFSSLPKCPIICESDNQRAQCAGLPGLVAESNGRSPP